MRDEVQKQSQNLELLAEQMLKNNTSIDEERITLEKLTTRLATHEEDAQKLSKDLNDSLRKT